MSPGSDKPRNPRKDAKGDWQEYASFMVYFERKEENGVEEKRTTVRRTGIHHIETGDQSTWPGIAVDRACQWLDTRLSEAVKPPPREKATKGQEASIPSVLPVLAIDEIRVLQRPGINAPQTLRTQEGSFAGYVYGNEPLAFEVSFEVTGPGAAGVIKTCKEYDVSFYARDLDTAVITHLGTTASGQIEEGKYKYRSQLRSAMLPVGLYGLRIIVTFKDAVPLAAYSEVPFLQVM